MEGRKVRRMISWWLRTRHQGTPASMEKPMTGPALRQRAFIIDSVEEGLQTIVSPRLVDLKVWGQKAREEGRGEGMRRC